MGACVVDQRTAVSGQGCDSEYATDLDEVSVHIIGARVEAIEVVSELTVRLVCLTDTASASDRKQESKSVKQDDDLPAWSTSGALTAHVRQSLCGTFTLIGSFLSVPDSITQFGDSNVGAGRSPDKGTRWKVRVVGGVSEHGTVVGSDEASGSDEKQWLADENGTIQWEGCLPDATSAVTVLQVSPISAVRVEGVEVVVGHVDGHEASSVEATDGGSVTDSNLTSKLHAQNGGGTRRLEMKFVKPGGLDSTLKRVRETVFLALFRRRLFYSTGLSPPRGVLMYGIPGTGKTLIAKTIARECGASFIVLNGGDVTSKFVGESEAKLRETFAEARRRAPSVIFIDEIDALCPKRDDSGGMSGAGSTARVVATVLTLLDGMPTAPRDRKDGGADPDAVVVLAATNRPDALDPALRRPGRFDHEIEVPVPSAEGRRQILEAYLACMALDASVDVDTLVSATHGFVGADLSMLCREAQVKAIEKTIPAGVFTGDMPEHDTIVDGDASKVAAEVHVSMTEFQHALKGLKPSALREYAVEVPRTRWMDIGGCEEAKRILQEAVEWPLVHQDTFRRLGIRPSRGVLMYGPPGCAKTMMARAVASECGLNFLAVKGPELFNMYVGESERQLRTLFGRARQAAPAVIFFDEIDAIAASRDFAGDGGGGGVENRLLNTLLNEIDGVDSPLAHVIVLAATNRPHAIDHALLRPGRMDKLVHVGLPDDDGRRAVFEVHLRKVAQDENDPIRIDDLVSASDGYSSAEIAGIVREALMSRVGRIIRAMPRGSADRDLIEPIEPIEPMVQVGHGDLVEALKECKPRTSTEVLDMLTNFRAQH